MTGVTTVVKTVKTLFAAGTSNAAGATARAAISLQTAQGGFLTFKITNGGTGPSAQCTATVHAAHNATTPSTGAAGADWKTIYGPVGGGTANSAVSEWYLPVDPAIMALQIEFGGNATQAVTIEAIFSELTSANTV